MIDMTHLETTRRGYDSMAVRYTEFIRDPSNDEPFGRALIGVFAHLVDADAEAGDVIDVGCGPGQWTDLLDQLGLSVRGIDLSPAMIEIARRGRPELSFEVGSIFDLDAADSSLRGVLAHFSIIHTPPEHVPAALAECARVLGSGGHLVLSFQSGDESVPTWAAFDHKVSPAYRWSIDALAELLRSQGLVEVARLLVQPAPGRRFPDGHLLARKTDC